MIRHLIPRFMVQSWYGDALTINPAGGREMPDGLARRLNVTFGHPTITPERDEVRGGTLTIQWLGLMTEICIGRVR